MKVPNIFKNKSVKRYLLILLCLLSCFLSLLFAKITYAYSNEPVSIENIEQLRKANPEDIAALSSYDSRDFGIVTPVKDQQDSNLCWAYASAAASEISILRSGIEPNGTKDNLSLSPLSLAYSRWIRPSDPLGNTPQTYEQESSNWYNSSGAASYCASLMSQWCGPVGGANSANANPFENAMFHLDNAVHIKSTDISQIKLAIAKYGAVTFSYNNVRETEFYNPVKESGTASYPHACTLIGWNDDIPAEDFKPNGANGNGGWLVKNSYNTLPYFWLSYDVTSDMIYAFDFTAKETYDNNYFYDYNLTDHLNYTLKIKKACEIYEAKKTENGKTEYLKAVNIGFIGKNVTAKVNIYVDMQDESNPETGTRVGGGEEILDYGGFRTVNLETPVPLTKGQRFACVVSIENEDGSAVLCNMLGKTGNNAFIYKDYWQSANNYTPRIKAFTSLKENTEPEPHIHSLVTYGEQAATCTEGGILAHEVCSTCGKYFINGEEKTQEELKIPATGHAYGEWENVTSATCLTEGNKRRTCGKCGQTETATVAIDPNAHIYGEWTDEVPPTTSTDGIKGHKDCMVCGKHFDVNNNEISDIVIPKITEETKFTVTVENGYIDGVEANFVTVDKNGSITITAKEIEGKIFKGWSADGGKTILNASSTYTFTVAQDLTLTAVYLDLPVSPKNGLSCGAIAGITVSVILLSLIPVCIILLKRRRKK